MKLAFFDDFRLGVVKGDNIVDVTNDLAEIPRLEPQHLISGLIANFESYRDVLEARAAAETGHPLSDVRLRPPLPNPQNIVCMASNYMEYGLRKETPPLNAFAKPSSCVIGDGDEMLLPDVPATVFEGEAEIAVVFGKRASNVSEHDAMDHVFGYTNFIDGSARGLGPDRNIYFMMKSRDTFGPMGPFIVTSDEIDDPQNLSIKLWNNGEIRQDYNTDDMAYSIRQCIAWLTAIHTVEPGDILAMGTNHSGLHAFADGDRIEMETEGLGRLNITVRDPLERTWTRETHLNRMQQGFTGMRNMHATQLTGKYKPE